MNTLHLRLGGVSILFRSRDLSFEYWEAFYEPFLADGAAAHDVVADCELVVGGNRGPRRAEKRRLLAPVRDYLRQVVPESPVRNRIVEYRMEVVSGLLSSAALLECLQAFDPLTGRWRSLRVNGPHVWLVDADVRRAQIFLSSGLVAEDPAIVLDGFLYELVRSSLARQRGLILHAAGVVAGERSFVFVGPSGAGKTTIARAAKRRGLSVLADDGLIVRQMPGGALRAFRTPWRMMVPPWCEDLGDQPESAEVSATFFVEHGASDRWQRLGPIDAAALLVANTMGPLRQVDARHTGHVFEVLSLLGSEVPSYHLWFTPTCEFLVGIDKL